MRFDHVALEVGDIENTVQNLKKATGLEVLREGSRYSTGQRIVMLGDETGIKIELIESDLTKPTFAHIAFRVDGPASVDLAADSMLSAGWAVKTLPHDLPHAKARSTLLVDEGGLQVQVIAYSSDSPDVGWSSDGSHTSVEGQ